MLSRKRRSLEPALITLVGVALAASMFRLRASQAKGWFTTGLPVPDALPAEGDD